LRARSEEAVSGRLSAIKSSTPETVATATLTVQTDGEGFTELTGEVTRFIAEAAANDGVLLLYLRHTSASLVIQENADPAVQTDLGSALRRLAPADAGWVHGEEGPDDMPAHIKAMLTSATLGVPVMNGRAQLGTWQAIYLIEHRDRPHRRELLLHFVGTLGA
jgi:secondary thiamine-phosphate synthase enzyme